MCENSTALLKRERERRNAVRSLLCVFSAELFLARTKPPLMDADVCSVTHLQVLKKPCEIVSFIYSSLHAIPDSL